MFAPTDAAFDRLPAGTVDALLKDTPRLRSVLTYHVVPGKVTAGEVVKLDSAATVNGERLKIRTADGAVRVNNARVTKTDVVCSNGVIHVIDAVLLPPEK